MRTHQILGLLVLITVLASCKSEAQQHKEQVIESKIWEMQAEVATTTQTGAKESGATPVVNTTNNVHATPKSQNIPVQTTPKQLKQQAVEKADAILGLWEVKNDYYYAIFEIEKYQGKYTGKIHYYNDGTKEYKGKNTKDDYFLENVIFTNGAYQNGKMYMPNGTNYQVAFNLKSDTELVIKMTVEGQPYSEIWKRTSITQ